MTIQTGRGKRGGARADLMTGDRESGLTQRDSKDVPQFAPNFTVYVLPPDVVCLYSEDRKFFLHGELYCALASAIGGRKELSGARSRAGAGFSVRQDPRSPEAAGRPPLSWSRHRALPRTHAAAYWASLGLPPEDAKRNLQKCRVRIQSIDVQGATELGAALEQAGRSRREARRRPDGHAGERLSRRATGRIEPAASVGPHALAAGPALRHFSAGGAGVQPRARAPAGPVLPIA